MFQSPGVYIQEVDQSLYVAAQSGSVAGFVGVTERGPVGEAVLVTNWPQYVETFGGLIATSELPYAVKHFFDQGGSVLWVVRVVHYTDVADPATATAEASTVVANDTTPAPAWNLSAATPGTWGDDIDVVITGAGPFDVEVKYGGVRVERFFQVQDTDATATDYVETVINGVSAYITVEAVGNTPVAATYSLAGGDDGLTSLADTDYLGSEAGKTGLRALDTIEGVRLFAVPGVETPAVHAGLLSYVEGRGDGFAILGTPSGLTPAEAVTYREGTGAYSHSAFNSTYGAIYWPWIKFADERTGTVRAMPVEGVMAGLIARNDAEAAVWYAPAGLNRGLVRGAVGVEHTTTDGERDVLYSAQVNPIANFRSGGIAVWGQKTLSPKPSAMDRVNVRRLNNYIKVGLSDTSRFLLFEPNDRRTWEAFRRFAQPFMQTIQQGRGVYAYQVICDETTNTPAVIDRNEMVAIVAYQPTKTSEVFVIRQVVTQTGVTFSEA